MADTFSSTSDSSPADEASRAAGASQRPATTRAMEEEVYGLLGALLGMLEVLSIDTSDPLPPRQQRLLADALRFGDMLRARVEALVVLLSDGDDPRFALAEYPLRRLIDHAVRGASWSAADKGVALVLPPSGPWEQVQLRIDAARVDRALRGVTDTLVAALPAKGQVVVQIAVHEERAAIELSGIAPEATEQPVRLTLSEVLFMAWQRVFALSGGSLHADCDGLRVRVELPSWGRG